MSDLNDVYTALRVASRIAEQQWQRASRSEAIRDAQFDMQAIDRGQAAVARLEREISVLRPFKAAAERSYDRYVTRPRYDEDDEREGCSCHISAPCGYCTRDADDEEEAVTQPKGDA